MASSHDIMRLFDPLIAEMVTSLEDEMRCITASYTDHDKRVSSACSGALSRVIDGITSNTAPYVTDQSNLASHGMMSGNNLLIATGSFSGA